MKRALLLIIITCRNGIDQFHFFILQKESRLPCQIIPQLVGNWPGTTSQGTSISLGVTNIKGNLYINQYDLMVYTTTGYQEYKAGSGDGLAAIPATQFKIHIGTGNAGESYIDGTFV